MLKTSVVVANHGRDLTLLKASLPDNVEFIEINRGFERSKQRNMGILESTGDIVIWLDSDQVLSKGVVEECENLIRLGYAAVYIPEIIIGNSWFAKLRNFERQFYTGTAVDVPKAVLRKNCPLFDETMSGPEDADWGQRIRGLRATCTKPLYHYDDIPFLDYCRKKAYYTKSMKNYISKNPTDKCIKIKYRCFDVFVEDGKWKRLIKHPILAMGIVFLLIVRGIIYYANK